MTDVISAPAASARPRPGRSPRRLDVTSPEAQARVRRRYRAESRFKLYGVIALTVTTVFLVVLIADILTRGLPAFWQHSVVFDVPVKAEEIDPENKRAELAQQAAELRSPSAARGSCACSWGLGLLISRPIPCSRSAPGTTSASSGRRSTMPSRASRDG